MWTQPNSLSWCPVTSEREKIESLQRCTVQISPHPCGKPLNKAKVQVYIFSPRASWRPRFAIDQVPKSSRRVRSGALSDWPRVVLTLHVFRSPLGILQGCEIRMHLLFLPPGSWRFSCPTPTWAPFKGKQAETMASKPTWRMWTGAWSAISWEGSVHCDHLSPKGRKYSEAKCTPSLDSSEILLLSPFPVHLLHCCPHHIGPPSKGGLSHSMAPSVQNSPFEAKHGFTFLTSWHVFIETSFPTMALSWKKEKHELNCSLTFRNAPSICKSCTENLKIPGYKRN